VPLAVPFIAGPSAIATVLLLVSREPQRLWEWLGALSVAMAISAVVLGFAEKIADFLGEQVTMAFERLMGLILTAIAIQMLLVGIQGFVLQVRAAGG
jgi:small neutral amino acid transporter SnatA (MarC family)